MNNIKDLQARQGNVEVLVDIVDISPVREFEKFGKKGRVANANAKDATGEVKLTLWNEQIDQIKVGDKVHLSNGYVGEYNGELQLSAGKFGTLEVVKGEASAPAEKSPVAVEKEEVIPEVKVEKKPVPVEESVEDDSEEDIAEVELDIDEEEI